MFNCLIFKQHLLVSHFFPVNIIFLVQLFYKADTFHFSHLSAVKYIFGSNSGSLRHRLNNGGVMLRHKEVMTTSKATIITLRSE